ncbi:deubiquitinase OTUD6B [Procambarus clarkii]|uniref:deubiquitinase OTUD6B n=1 Tax=Procambarus clarkii TaxID=6728 RepID=UPI001E6710ED|nr:deubiquitinase OTUD6B-like [Procambarus clarkii]XP_045620358.1 deubiquitinase OTUD6B-like [Procambarus clarkii]XP_045620359.1 deubiquitinase OTUD6B-like [Procambarus clarkii]
MTDDASDLLFQEEELLSKHRREKKELQAQIQQLKKSTNKDKKKKKEALEDIAKLEKELKDRHEEELTRFKPPQEVDTVSNGVDSLNLSDDGSGESQPVNEEEEPNLLEQDQGKRISKAEKRRQKKAEAIREREARIREEEANNKYSARNIEAEKLKHLLRERKLKMHEIKPDGNCMYAAIAHQMGGNATVPWLRSQAGHFIRTNYEAFAPFITDPKTGESLTPQQFAEYCSQVEHTPSWGGQPELRALSQVMQRKIEVLQAEGTPVIFGEECTDKKTILLAYYRHSYGLGEHYNSVTDLNSVPEEQSR